MMIQVRKNLDKSSPTPQVPYPYVDIVTPTEKVSAELNVEKSLKQGRERNEKDEDKKDV